MLASQNLSRFLPPPPALPPRTLIFPKKDDPEEEGSVDGLLTVCSEVSWDSCSSLKSSLNSYRGNASSSLSWTGSAELQTSHKLPSSEKDRTHRTPFYNILLSTHHLIIHYTSETCSVPQSSLLRQVWEPVLSIKELRVCWRERAGQDLIMKCWNNKKLPD